MTYQQCKRCVMDNATDSSITFDENGYCNYCSDVIKREPLEYTVQGGGTQFYYY